MAALSPLKNRHGPPIHCLLSFATTASTQQKNLRSPEMDGTEEINAFDDIEERATQAWLIAVLCSRNVAKTDTLRFLFEDPDGKSVEIGYERLLGSIRVAERHGILPRLPPSWWLSVNHLDHIEARIATQLAIPEPAELCAEPYLLQVIALHDYASDTHLMDVYLMSLVQCLCIAEQCGYVPRLDPAWEAQTTPSGFREFCKSVRIQ